MTVHMHNSGSEGSLVNASGVGLPKPLLEVLRHASIAKLDRVLRLMLDHQIRLAMHRWRYTSMQRKEADKLVNIKSYADTEHKSLKQSHEDKLAQARREWKKDREDHVRTHGIELDDCVRMSTEEVHRMRMRDNKHRENLDTLQQQHIKEREDVKIRANRQAMECEHRMNIMNLAGLIPLAKPSRAASGRIWDVEDFDTEPLQWAFTTAPDNCLVPFKQAVEMKEQQNDLAKRLQLILEYGDKLPQWYHRASTNRGKNSKTVSQIGPDWRATPMKSILRRVQASCALRPSFVKITQVPRGAIKTRRKSATESVFAPHVWDHAETIIQSQAPANSRKSVFIKHVDENKAKHSFKRRSSGEYNSDDSQEDHLDSRRTSLNSNSNFVEVVRAAERRRSSLLLEQAGLPFHLGDDYGYRFDMDSRHTHMARRNSSSTVRPSVVDAPKSPSQASRRASFCFEPAEDAEIARRASSARRNSVRAFPHIEEEGESAIREENLSRNHSQSVGTEYRQADEAKSAEMLEDTNPVVNGSIHTGDVSPSSSSSDEEQ